MKLLKLLTVLFLASILFAGCAGMQLEKEVASVPADHMRVSIINDTDIVMCHTTYWLNHNIPDLYGPSMVCGGEIEPGGDHTFDRNVSSWHFEGTRIYRTNWYPCRYGVYGDEAKRLKKKYSNRVVVEIPEGTAIIKIYHDRYEVILR
jgi:hypothetical protein